ncbi:MAG: acyl-CoA thioesterase II [Alphaproteobacteria bacterium]|nr:acyl-CoA thioesterase II [Alphaproteobacteria bacterium]
MTPLEDLIALLKLEPIEVNMFRGRARAADRHRIFGGHVIAQALMAAYQTIEGRVCHSLQAYFIRPGDPAAPVLYEVERSRDGKSFTTRRVIAIQHGEQILNLAASFQVHEDGYEHQTALPQSAGPDAGFPDAERFRELRSLDPARFAREAEEGRPIDMRWMELSSMLNPEKLPPQQQVWLRADGVVGDDAALNQALLAWASDWALLSTCMRPHAANWLQPGFQSASLDHIIWFHRPTIMSEWHLYDMDSPSASGARGFNRGAIYRQDGTLVASVAQEGLIRQR